MNNGKSSALSIGTDGKNILNESTLPLSALRLEKINTYRENLLDDHTQGQNNSYNNVRIIFFIFIFTFFAIIITVFSFNLHLVILFLI